MCPTKQKHRAASASAATATRSSSAAALAVAETAATTTADWREEAINGGSLRHVDLHTGSNGWASPPGDLFFLRGKHYLSKKQKYPSGDWLLKPAGVDWLRASSKLDNVLGRPDNRVVHALRKAQTQAQTQAHKTFIVAVNLQVPGRDHHSAVFYFATDDPIPLGSLLGRFVHGDDSFRNQRFKIVNRIVKGPWIVKAAVGNYSACLLGKALTCNYHKGPNYLEIDVDIGSSAIANAILHLALGYVTSVTIDMGFLVEAQAEDELPERLFGAVRICQMEMSSAKFVEASLSSPSPAVAKKFGLAKVNHHRSEDEDADENAC
ncbi:protein ENHANCED DISEASE RESISTANCE 2-like [Malania oleifera]|uniref:protein ENHANCED DISEASE RESISTANCE 2-like n=1 Tax=Malania oleifera TaxID=397392 RepID=UPI0025AE1594|nr:protein ENHANCED DISEASE RESISTANCE 2-like [Malania oleifera]XP_057959722.1 protein ENHANCED DISEASE RESISTANCE 2-like [Malania oleifera]XP_057959723.1 protein ENHANCED DISEASE RESISTANCE 2-like [Malania oleifera]